MKRKQDLDKVWRELCADLDADDCLSSEELERQDPQSKPDGGIAKPDKSTLRLCAQVRRAVDLALAADCGDPDLQALRVARVEPYPDARRLRVHLCRSAEAGLPGSKALDAKISAVSHLLTHAAARCVHRKRSPRLVFLLVPEGEEENHG